MAESKTTPAEALREYHAAVEENQQAVSLLNASKDAVEMSATTFHQVESKLDAIIREHHDHDGQIIRPLEVLIGNTVVTLMIGGALTVSALPQLLEPSPAELVASIDNKTMLLEMIKVLRNEEEPGLATQLLGEALAQSARAPDYFANWWNIKPPILTEEQAARMVKWVTELPPNILFGKARESLLGLFRRQMMAESYCDSPETFVSRGEVMREAEELKREAEESDSSKVVFGGPDKEP